MKMKDLQEMQEILRVIFLYLVIPVVIGIVVTMFQLQKPLQKFRDWAFADENLPPEKITFKIIERITETHSGTDTVYKPSVGINMKGDVGTLLILQKEENEVTKYYFVLENSSGTKFRVEVSKKIWDAHESKETFSVLKKKNFFDEIVYTHDNIKIRLKEVGKQEEKLK